MRLRPVIALSTLSIAAAVALANDANACGGCFVQQSENSIVSGHRMALSISTTQTTLWDQITYSGDPAEFAWVLPIRGQVDIGLSSDALFALLESYTTPQISSPFISCPPPPDCGGDGNAFGGGTSGTGGGSEDGGVEIIAQEVVGPYETVQLTAEDPAALAQWLDSHGYNVPADVQPVIDDYVFEGFGFLALRLVPGQGVDSMRPIRVTTPGAAPALPLRMVAAGTGAITPISLWVLGEGRYEPENFPSFQVDPTALVWNWDEQKSNYSDLRQAGFAASDGAGWILEAGEPTGSWMFQQLVDTANWDPIGSGYADETGEKAVENAEADVTTLLTGINENSLWISRMSAELARAALGQDLALQASSDQATIQRFFEAQNAVGTPPACPPQPECPDGGIDDVAGDPFGDSGDDVLGDSSSCTASGTTDATGGGLVGLALALGAGAVLRRRRRA